MSYVEKIISDVEKIISDLFSYIYILLMYKRMAIIAESETAPGIQTVNQKRSACAILRIQTIIPTGRVCR